MTDNIAALETRDTQLPEPRTAAVQSGLAAFHEMAAERDSYRQEVRALKIQIAAHTVNEEGLRSQLADAESRVASCTLVRDQAVADRAKFETLLISIQAQLRAFVTPAAPLVQQLPDGDSDSLMPHGSGAVPAVATAAPGADGDQDQQTTRLVPSASQKPAKNGPKSAVSNL